MKSRRRGRPSRAGRFWQPSHVVDDGGSRAAVEVVVRGGYVVRIGEQATTEHIRRVLQTISELE